MSQPGTFVGVCMTTHLRRSRVLREARSGKISTVFKLNLSDPRVAEIIAAAGVSALWLCNEHVPNDWLNLENQIRAAALHGADVIVRVAKGSYSDYLRPFEAGATGLMIPHVTSAEEARQVVRLARFHPLGKRPMDGGNTDGLYTRVPAKEYVEFCNAEKFIILQIESPEGLENIEEIAAVEGYDFLMLGPGDFAHQIGKPGEIDCPEVTQARARVEAAARAHGKGCVAIAVPGTPEELLARGYVMTTVGSDVSTLTVAALEALKPFGNRESADGTADSPYAR